MADEPVASYTPDEEKAGGWSTPVRGTKVVPSEPSPPEEPVTEEDNEE